MPPQDPILANIQGVSQLVGSDVNKTSTTPESGDEGAASERQDALTLDLDDDKLLALRDQWEADYATYESLEKIPTRQKANEKYYAGRQLEGTGFYSEFPIAANLQWEAAETFYPAALARNPEPTVFCDNTPEGNKISSDVKTMLAYHAEELGLRPKLNRLARQHSINFLGVLKHGWDKEKNDITTDNRPIRNFKFDPKGYVDVFGHFVGYVGEGIEVTAEKAIELFPAFKEYFEQDSNNKLGTKITYTEWWTDEMCFTTYKTKVLDKHKNEFFNYPEQSEDELGFPTEDQPTNHFHAPMKPYTFLSVYTLGEGPFDITNQMEQNIPNQNLITKRTMQIDSNLSRQNNNTVFSEDNFNQETAKQAANAMEKGNPVLIPQGKPISEAIAKIEAKGFPQQAFEELENNKQNLKNSWGINGIASQPLKSDTPVRGMIMNEQRDNTRIGGSYGDALEMVAKSCFNWWVQLYYVFYDEPHYAAVLGKLKATEYVILTQTKLKRALIVGVQKDSMKPKDDLTLMNQAVQLWQGGALDIQTLLTVLDFPNPKETAAQVWLWRTNPVLYGQLNFPDIQKLIAGLQPTVLPVEDPNIEKTQNIEGENPADGGVAPNPGLQNVPIPKLSPIQNV